MSVLPVAMVALLTASLFAYSQSSQDAHILSIAGHSDYAKILELNGKSYVEVQDLARLTRGALTSEGNQILLTLPPETAHASVAAPQIRGFSKEFLQAGIEQMSAIREWRIT
jgi:hypothetical protein